MFFLLQTLLLMSNDIKALLWSECTWRIHKSIPLLFLSIYCYCVNEYDKIMIKQSISRLRFCLSSSQNNYQFYFVDRKAFIKQFIIQSFRIYRHPISECNIQHQCIWTNWCFLWIYEAEQSFFVQKGASFFEMEHELKLLIIVLRCFPSVRDSTFTFTEVGVPKCYWYVRFTFSAVSEKHYVFFQHHTK